jgi:L-arabinonolactonase
MVEVACVPQTRSELGEGPLWDTVEQALYWVDITGRLIHRFDPATGRDRTWATPEDVGSLALRERGGMVVALRSGFHFFDPETGHFQPIVDPEADRWGADGPGSRFNDGKPDRQGRFWAGSVPDGFAPPVGALYRLDRDLSCRRMVEGIACANALCWSPDGRIMYFGDSMANVIWAWDFDPAEGEIRNRRVFVQPSKGEGEIDGATVDAEGCVWVAQWGGWRVVRYDPRGRIDRVVMMPVRKPSCPAFGGARLDVIYVTTAAIRISPDEPPADPLDGALFAFEPGVKGVAESRFRG